MTKLLKVEKSVFAVLISLGISIPNLHAQAGYMIRQLNDVVGQLEWSRANVSSKSEIEGSPYLADDFTNGDVFYNGKFQIPNVALRLNLFNDEFEYKNKNSVLVFAEPDHIDKIVMDNEVFIYLKRTPQQEVYGFVKKWNTGFPAVLTKMKIEFKKKEEVQAFAESKPDRFERAADRHFIMKSEEEIARITSIKRLIKYLGAHASELSSFAKREKISSGDAEELAKLLDYFHSLE